MLLRELTELHGVSGFEKEVRAFIVEKLKAMDADYHIDKIGNVVVHNKGKNIGKTLMVSAHMDEVGLMISSINSDGTLSFRTVGGVEAAVLYSKQVLIGENRVLGVIGVGMGLNPKVNELRIDIGAKSKDEAEKLVSICDYVAFKSDYVEFGDKMIKAKALDDRVGCALILELLEKKIDLDFYAVFTVMEEVGLRGAMVAANVIKPDIAYVLEATICADFPETSNLKSVTKIGEGVAITIADGSSMSNINHVRSVAKIADDNNIPWQYKKGKVGGNDAGAIFKANAGCHVVSLSLPCRYIHSQVSVASLRDYESMKNLMFKVFQMHAEKGVEYEI